MKKKLTQRDRLMRLIGKLNRKIDSLCDQRSNEMDKLERKFDQQMQKIETRYDLLLSRADAQIDKIDKRLMRLPDGGKYHRNCRLKGAPLR